MSIYLVLKDIYSINSYIVFMLFLNEFKMNIYYISIKNKTSSKLIIYIIFHKYMYLERKHRT